MGAGMSVPVCTGWETFITKLEREAGTRRPGKRSGKKASSDELVRRALAEDLTRSGCFRWLRTYADARGDYYRFVYDAEATGKAGIAPA